MAGVDISRGDLTLVVDRGVGTEGGLLVLGALVLGQDGAGNGQAGDHVLLGELEAEALGVVVDVNDLGELQRQEALVAARERGLGGRLGGAGLAVVVVAATNGAGAKDVEERVAAAAGGGRGRRESELLTSCMKFRVG